MCVYIYIYVSCMHDRVYLGAVLRVHAGQGVLGGEDRKCVLEPAPDKKTKTKNNNISRNLRRG